MLKYRTKQVGKMKKNIRNFGVFLSFVMLVVAFQNCGKLNVLSSESPADTTPSQGEATQSSKEDSFFNFKLIDTDNNDNKIDLVINLDQSKMSVEENSGKRTNVDLSKNELDEVKSVIKQNDDGENENVKEHFWQLIRKKRILICPSIMVAQIECLDNEALVVEYRNGCVVGYVCKPKKVFECPLMPIAYPMCPSGKDPNPIYNENECLVGYRCE